MTKQLIYVDVSNSWFHHLLNLIRLFTFANESPRYMTGSCSRLPQEPILIRCRKSPIHWRGVGKHRASSETGTLNLLIIRLSRTTVIPDRRYRQGAITYIKFNKEVDL